MPLQFAKTPIAAALDSLIGGINSSGNGRIDIRSGTKPANLAATATGTLLATCDLMQISLPAYANTDTTTLIATGNLSSGVFAFEASIIATGTAGYFRLFSGLNVAVFQGTVTATGLGGELELSSTSLVIGGTVTITSSSIQIIGLD